MALTGEVTKMTLLDSDSGDAELEITYKNDGVALAVRKFRMNIQHSWNAETRASMIDKIKHVGTEIYRTQTRFATIQGNLVGQTITIL